MERKLELIKFFNAELERLKDMDYYNNFYIKEENGLIFNRSEESIQKIYRDTTIVNLLENENSPITLEEALYLLELF
jgi:hypothetical protein